MSWWSEHKELLSSKRKKRWADDESFRKRQKERDSQRRAQLRLVKSAHIIEKMQKRLDVVFGGNLAIPSLGIYQDGPGWLTTVGLAYVLDRSQATIQHWMAQKIIPQCSCMHGGRYLFDLQLCEVIVEAYAETLKQNLRGTPKIFKEILSRKLQADTLEVANGGKESKSSTESNDKGTATSSCNRTDGHA